MVLAELTMSLSTSTAYCPSPFAGIVNEPRASPQARRSSSNSKRIGLRGRYWLDIRARGSIEERHSTHLDSLRWVQSIQSIQSI